MARRGKSGGAYGKVVPPSNRSYMDAGEIEGRDAPVGAPSEESHFTQIGPGDSGGDASDPTFTHLSGDFKFTGGISK